jgi:hypothetical protein
LLRISKGRSAVIKHDHAWLSLLVCAGVGIGGWAIPAAGQTAAPADQAAVDSAKSSDDGALPPSTPTRPNATRTRGYVVGDAGVARSRPAPLPADDANSAAAGAGRGFYALPEVGDEVLAHPSGDSAATSDQQAATPAAPPIGVNEPGVNRARPPR